MKTHLLLFLLFLGFSSYGQLSVDPGDVNLNTDVSIADAKVDFNIRNDGTETLELWWNLEVLDGPDSWQYQICDCNLCYLPGLYTCPSSQSCSIGPGEEFTFMLHLLPNGVEGTGSVNMQVLDNHGDTVALLDTPVEVNVLGVSSNENESIESNLSLYPNPTHDGFKIANDEDVTQIVIFNILGKQIKTAEHTPGKTHSINNLDRGYYLIRIVDKYKNDKVLRLTKK